MKYKSFFIMSTVNCERFIKNHNIPSCKNCIYYKPETYSDFDSHINKCEKFGEKNIITDKIKIDYADMCRKDESKCGLNGKYFEKEKNVNIKMFKHTIQKNMHFLLILSISISISILYYAAILSVGK